MMAECVFGEILRFCIYIACCTMVSYMICLIFWKYKRCESCGKCGESCSNCSACKMAFKTDFDVADEEIIKSLSKSPIMLQNEAPSAIVELNLAEQCGVVNIYGKRKRIVVDRLMFENGDTKLVCSMRGDADGR